MTPIAEQVRKIGGLTLRSIGHISRTQRVLDNDTEYVEPLDMIAELADDKQNDGLASARDTQTFAMSIVVLLRRV